MHRTRNGLSPNNPQILTIRRGIIRCSWLLKRHSHFVCTLFSMGCYKYIFIYLYICVCVYCGGCSMDTVDYTDVCTGMIFVCDAPIFLTTHHDMFCRNTRTIVLHYNPIFASSLLSAQTYIYIYTIYVYIHYTIHNGRGEHFEYDCKQSDQRPVYN